MYVFDFDICLLNGIYKQPILFMNMFSVLFFFQFFYSETTIQTYALPKYSEHVVIAQIKHVNEHTIDTTKLNNQHVSISENCSVSFVWLHFVYAFFYLFRSIIYFSKWTRLKYFYLAKKFFLSFNQHTLQCDFRHFNNSMKIWCSFGALIKANVARLYEFQILCSL